MKEVLYRTSGEARYEASGQEGVEAGTDSGAGPAEVGDDHQEARQLEANPDERSTVAARDRDRPVAS